MIQRGNRAISLGIAIVFFTAGACADAPSDAEARALVTAASSSSSAPLRVELVPSAPLAAASSARPAPASPSASAEPVAVIAAAPSPYADLLAASPPRSPHKDAPAPEGPVDVSLDPEWLLRLASAPIVEVTPNRGGSSVSMRVRFADGKKAVLKPEQTGHPTDPRAEIAAYHLDRILGFGRTAAVAGRKIAASELRAALVQSGAGAAFLERLDSSVVLHGGTIDAALIAWHAAPLVEEEAEPAWASLLEKSDEPPPRTAEKLMERSDLVVFDFLIDNPDRFSGGNILRLGQAGALIFLDQGAAFGKNRLAQKLTTQARLDKVCRFRRSTLKRLAAFAPWSKGETRISAALSATLAKDRLTPVLDGPQIAGLEQRVIALAAHIRTCEDKLHRAAVLPSQH